jgi:8-amino-7-oxononanoate synthase
MPFASYSEAPLVTFMSFFRGPALTCYCLLDPIVPKGTALIRLVFHAHNTRDEIDHLLDTIGTWANEMMDIERSGSKNCLSTAQRRVLALQANGWK